jgi:beta-glucosidase
MQHLSFGDDFLWGAATAAFQIEGGTRHDGRGESIWDRFCTVPNAIRDGSDGTRACEHYERWPEDLKLMKWLGLSAYRFSVSWPRIQPDGRGRANPRGLDFYDRLVDALLEANIRPFVTLYHWDLPQPLEDAGGWPLRDTASAFADYAALVGQKLGDRVRDFVTHNEPYCASMFGYRDGFQAPGRKSYRDALWAAHHLLLSHGLAVQALRVEAPRAEVGITLNLVPTQPASASSADEDAARACDGEANRWFLDPLYGRGYPADVIEDRRREGVLESADLPFLRNDDLRIISERTDFLGVNYYVRAIARAKAHGKANLEPEITPRDERTAMGWEVFPEGLQRILEQVQRAYDPPRLYVTENGAAYDDQPPSSSGEVMDTERQSYILRHLAAVHRARSAGVKVGGYFLWSLLDNFEWSEGYTKRFGIVWVDYDSQARLPKQSAHRYRRVIAENGFAGVG